MGLFKKRIHREVKLEFSTCGEVFINELPFSFGVESAGKASDKGLCVSISGDAVNDGRVTFSNLEYHEKHGSKISIVKFDFPKVVKSDGKKIYQCKFTKIPLTEAGFSSLIHKTDEKEVIQRLNCEITFKVTPHYNGNEMPEVMLNIYPYENALKGSCTQWIKCTSDQDYFVHKYADKQEKKI